MTEGFTTKQRIYADADGKVVEETAPNVHHMLFGAGVEVSGTEAEEYGLDASTHGAQDAPQATPAPIAPMTEGGSFQAASETEGKAVAPAENKAVTPAETENKGA